MEKPFEIYNDFNELEFLFDSKWEDVFGELTKKRFGDNLLFAAIETVTISEIKSIGTTQYISYRSVEDINNIIHKEYLDVVKEIKGTSFGSPSQYYEWYKRKKYYYAIGKNEICSIPQSTILNTVIIEPTERPESKKYISDYDKKLTDTELKQFFADYTKCLLSKEWFKELPHFFILVKPISIQDEDTGLYIPLGNLYLKIGTKNKVDIYDYKKYVNHLKSAWFNKFGTKILKEFSEKKSSDEYRPKHELHPNLDKKLSIQFYKFDSKPVTINDYFYYAFDSDEFYNLRHTNLIYSKNPLILSLIKVFDNKGKIIETIKEKFDTKEDPKNILTKNIKGLKHKDPASTQTIEYFLLLLSKRRLALLLLFVFDFSIEETHSCVTFGNRLEQSTPESAEIYLRENLFIYPTKKLNKKLLADREALFLQHIIEKIQESNSSFNCQI
jgi:hypothetical protein